MSAPDIQADSSRKALQAGDDAAGQRLDQFLAAALAPDLSRSRIQTLIRDGHVIIGKSRIHEPKHRLSGGEEIVVALPAPEAPEPQAENIPLSILYEDADLIVIDKPAGLVVHPGAGNPSGTLVNALIHHCGDTLSGIGGVKRPGIVHRLDKDTSGVMVVAKTDTAHRALSEAFADHGRDGDLERAYQAFVWGEPEPVAGRVDAALGRAGADRTMRAVVPAARADARHAVTHYRVLEHYGGTRPAFVSLVQCRLETGRTHQIRVHMAHIGHPLLADPVYGRAFATKANRLPPTVAALVNGLGRQALHAGLLAFRHPTTGEIMRFETALPTDLSELQTALRSWTN